MTGGRRPAAPGGSSGSRAACRRGQRAGTGAHLIDLGSIRHADAILDLLAARRLAWPAARRDPATAVLSVLAADVDGCAAGSPNGRLAAAAPVAGLAARSVPARQPGRPPSRAGGWARPVTTAAAIAGTLAAIALGVLTAVSGLMAAGMIARLLRFGTSLPAGRAARAPRHVRPGRGAAGRNRRRH